MDMDIGTELRSAIYSQWLPECVSYDLIRWDMEGRSKSGWTGDDEKYFLGKLEQSVEMVRRFMDTKQREIEHRISLSQRTLDRATIPATFDSVAEQLADMLVIINDLGRFARLNFKAIKNLFEILGQYTGKSQHSNFVGLLRKLPQDKSLDDQRFDLQLIKISMLYDNCQLRGQKREGNAAAGLDQNAFERATAKYWVHPDNITEVKAIILFHLPVLVFNKDKPIESSDSAISSVYMDNNNFDLYSERLQRSEGAEAIRLRWYGPMDSSSVFIERKTHHAPWLDGVSIKDRCRLDSVKVGDYLSSKYKASDYEADLLKSGASEQVIKDNLFVASGVQRSVNERELDPTLRVFYNRIAYQVPGDQRLRISLDSDLTFVREDCLDGQQRRKQGEWRRKDMGIDYPFKNIPPQDVYKFPYAVLETKLQTHLGQDPPEWLTKLLKSNLVYEVPRFSKYLQGAAHFFKPDLPLLPWWLDDLTRLDIRFQKNSEYSGLSRSKSFKPLIDGHYRLGYLETQLKKRGTIKRSPSGVTRTMSTRRQAALPTIPAKQLSDDPYDDPIWSTSSTPNQAHYSSRFPQASSQECLLASDGRVMTPTPRSSVTRNATTEKNAPQNNLNLRDPLVAAEEGDVDPGTRGRSGKQFTGFFGFIKKLNVDRKIGLDQMTKKRRKNLRGRQEPKAFFANERTFLHWLQFAMLILSAALTLVNFGDATAKYTGAAFFGIAMFMAIYSYFFQRWRSRIMRTSPDQRYDDIYGPIMLCVLLVAALIANFVIRVVIPPQTSTYLGINSQTGQQTN